MNKLNIDKSDLERLRKLIEDTDPSSYLHNVYKAAYKTFFFKPIYNFAAFNPYPYDDEIKWGEDWFKTYRYGLNENGELYDQIDLDYINAAEPELREIENLWRSDGTWEKLSGDKRFEIAKEWFRRRGINTFMWSGWHDPKAKSIRNTYEDDQYLTNEQGVADAYSYLWNPDTYFIGNRYDKEENEDWSSIPEGHTFLFAVPDGNIANIEGKKTDEIYPWYRLPVKRDDNKLVFDESIPISDRVTTDLIVEWAKELGYDGVLIGGPDTFYFDDGSEISQQETNTPLNLELLSWIAYLSRLHKRELFPTRSRKQFEKVIFGNTDFSKKLIPIGGTNFNPDFNNRRDRYGYNENQQDILKNPMARFGMKLIPKKRYIK